MTSYRNLLNSSRTPWKKRLVKHSVGTLIIMLLGNSVVPPHILLSKKTTSRGGLGRRSSSRQHVPFTFPLYLHPLFDPMPRLPLAWQLPQDFEPDLPVSNKVLLLRARFPFWCFMRFLPHLSSRSCCFPRLPGPATRHRCQCHVTGDPCEHWPHFLAFQRISG